MSNSRPTPKSTTGPGNTKPTLVARTLRQHLLAVVLTLLVTLGLMLWLTDTVILTARRHALRQQLTALESVDNAVLLLSDLGDEDQTGTALLDVQGHWRMTDHGLVSRQPGTPEPKGVWQEWTEAPRIVRSGYWHDIGSLPWVKEPVIWAAQLLTAPDAHREIVVAWEPVQAVRESLLPVYVLVMGAMLLVFGISAALTLRGTRRLAQVIEGFADSSERLAAGDYEIRLPPQPTRELDRVTVSVNELAQSLRQATADLRAEEERLERLERLQRQFVADASHELRAPLTSMRVTLEAWQDGVLQPVEHGEAIGHLLQETARLSSLVTRLLALSRLESGRQPLDLGPVNLREAAEEAAATCRHVPGAPTTVDVPADLPAAWADPEALHQVLCNLLENARRHTPAEGQVRIWARAEEAALRLGVTDTGRGIEPEFLPLIWNRFARGGEEGGSGLGLAIVKAWVEAMGGRVGAESTLGVGTTVWCDLPPAQNES